MYPTAITEQNPDATMPLTMGAYVTSNTPDEQILENLKGNCRRETLTAQVPAHTGTAILCGGGPSLEDTLEWVEAAQSAGGIVFALNGAATFLLRHGITPDYQVIMDAKPETLGLVEPSARSHLFAAQVDPSLFDAVPTAIQWYSAGGDLIPEVSLVIGGSFTVGNTALGLVYALGYRRMECFGYDSSHRERKSHAYPQPMNDDDPLTVVEFGGKKYLCSVVMRLQAKWFMQRAAALKEAGVSLQVHGEGLLPAMFHSPPMSEREKYEAMWKVPDYRLCSPGEHTAEDFVRIANPRVGQKVVDLGCGTGRGGAKIKRLTGCDVAYVDFAANCKNDGQPDIICDLADTPADIADFGYCTDVLEHIPPARLVDTVNGIMRSSPRVFFQISTTEDSCGDLIGQTLHMNVCDSASWLEFMQQIQTHRLRYYEDRGHSCLFYLTRAQS